VMREVIVHRSSIAQIFGKVKYKNNKIQAKNTCIFENAVL